MSANEYIEALESDLARYVIDRKVDESMQRYLKTRVYPIASILGAFLVFFGIRLGSLYQDYGKLQTRADESAAAYKKQSDNAKQLAYEVSSLRDSLKNIQNDIKNEVAAANATLRTQQAFLQSNLELQTAATSRADSLAANTEAALKRAEEARDATASLAKEVALKAAQASLDSNTAAASKDLIEKARNLAVQYQEEAATQKKILGLTVIDFAILARKIPSTVTLQDPRDGNHPIVLTMTPQSVSMQGFTIDIRKNGLPETALHIDKSTFGRWNRLPGTDGLYRYMVDFVYEQRGVRNFVVIRFGGAPELFGPASAERELTPNPRSTLPE